MSLRIESKITDEELAPSVPGNDTVDAGSKKLSFLYKSKVFRAFADIFIWYPKNYDAPEKKLLFKLDVVILVYICLGYFVKTMDSANVRYAYVSGMKEDLSLYGNQLNWINWYYTIGYCIGQLPGLILLSRPKTSKYVFPTLELCYGIFTICQSRVNHIHQLYAMRFMIGFFEAPHYTGTHYVLGKWYGTNSYRGNSTEVYKRAATWYASQSLANFFTGHLQAAAYENLNGVHGYKGWQWLFLIDGIITIPIAVLGYVIWPGIPESGKPWFLTEDQYDLVFKRLKRFGVKKANKLTVKSFIRTLSDWKWYLFCFNYLLLVLSWYPISYFSLWLKAKGYSVVDTNRFPTYSDIIALFVCLIGTTLAGVYAPWKVFVICCSGPLVCSIILTVYHVPNGAVFFAFYFSHTINATTTILFSYANTVMRDDNEIKAITMGSMMIFAQIVPVSISFSVFPTADKKNPARAAPQWNIGWKLTIVSSALMAVSFVAIVLLHERDKRLGRTSSKELYDENEDSSSELEVASHDVSSDDVNAKDGATSQVKEVEKI